MRILVVNWQDRENPQAGGAEIHLHEIFGRLATQGHEVTLALRRLARLPAARDARRHRRPSRRHAPHAFRSARVATIGRDLARLAFDILVEDINKVPLYTPRWGAHAHAVALVPHLFGATAFQELPRAARRGGVAGASGRSGRVYRDVPFEAISESTADDLVARGIPRAVDRR